MLRLKHHIENECRRIWQYPADWYCLEIPADAAHGDFASKLAFRWAKEKKQNPKQLAESLAESMRQAKPNWLTEVSTAGPYINLRLGDEWLFNKIADCRFRIVDLRCPTDDLYESSDRREDSANPQSPIPNPQLKNPHSQILLEYVSANPTGPLHIGHARWAIVGDCLARLLKATGHDVQREFYINDAGVQVQNLHKTVAALKAGQPVPEGGYNGAYIKDLLTYEGDPAQKLLAEQKQTLAKAGVEFDVWFSEKTLHADQAIEKTLKLLSEKDFSFEQDGALWFRSTAFGDDKDRVLRKSDGSLTYFAADIAYHLNKLQRGFTELINFWGADHHGYIKRVEAAVEALLKSQGMAYMPGKTLRVILGQLVNLFRDGEPVRMSKRTGDIITMDEVMEEIGVDALRYLLVRKSVNTPLDFDLGLAVKQSSENPVYYVQYAHARLSSILRKAKEQGIADCGLRIADLRCPTDDLYESSDRREDSTNLQSAIPNPQLILHPAEHAVILKALLFPDVLADAATSLEPYRLCAYLEELANLLHVFYHECRVIDQENLPQTQQRLLLVEKIRELFKAGLGLLGVSAPEAM